MKKETGVIFLTGDDRFLLDQAIETHTRGKACRFLKGEELSCDQVDSLLLAPSFFQEKKTILIDSFCTVKKAVEETIIRYLKYPDPLITLILASDAVKATSPLYKEAKNHTHIQLPKCPPWEKERRYEQVLIEYLQEQKKKIEPALIKKLSTMICSSYSGMKMELEKLFTYAGDAPVSADAIDHVIIEAKETIIWKISDAIISDSAKTLLHLQKQLQDAEVHPLVPIRYLSNTFSQYLNISSRVDSGQYPQKIQEALPKLKGKQFDKSYQIARHFGSHKLRKALLELTSLQEKLKNSPNDENSTFQSALLRIKYALHAA